MTAALIRKSRRSVLGVVERDSARSIPQHLGWVADLPGSDLTGMACQGRSGLCLNICMLQLSGAKVRHAAARRCSPPGQGQLEQSGRAWDFRSLPPIGAKAQPPRRIEVLIQSPRWSLALWRSDRFGLWIVITMRNC